MPKLTLTDKELKKYDVTDLSVKLSEYRAQVQSLTNDIRNLEKKISEIMDSIDLVKDSEKKITNDKTEFYCNKCNTRFVVSNDKCKIAFGGEGGLKANVYKYYNCPKCTNICWSNVTCSNSTITKKMPSTD